MSDPYGIVTFDVDGKLQSSYDFLEYLKGVLGAIGDRIGTEELARAAGDAALSLRIDGFNASFLEGVQASLLDLLDRLNNEVADRIEGDETISSRIDVVDVAVGNAAASVVQEAITRASEIAAMASLITAVTARVGSTEADITTEQTARATADTALATQITTVNARVGATEASITSEQTARANAIAALASTLTVLTTRVGTAESTITTESVARTAENYSLATRIDTLEANVGGDVEALVQAEATARADADTAFASTLNTLNARVGGAESAITNEQTTRANADIAIAGTVSALTTRMGSAEAAITAEQTARSNSDSSFASQIGTINTTLNGQSASINSVSSSVNGVLLKHSILLNSNGHITGFIQNNNGSSGSFTIVADNFSIIAPNGGSPVTPFAVTAEGVRINGNLVVNGSINTDQLALNSVSIAVTAFAEDSIYLPAETPSSPEAIPSVTQLRSIWISTVGGPVTLICQTTVAFSLDYGRIRFKRNGSVIRTGGELYYTSDGILVHLDNPPAGVHNYTVELVYRGSGNYAKSTYMSAGESRR